MTITRKNVGLTNMFKIKVTREAGHEIKNGMNTSINNQFDAIDNLIFTEGLRIESE